MTRRRIASVPIVAVVMVIAMASPVARQARPPQQAPPEPRGAISGVVIDAVTGAPVPGATVSLGDLDTRDRVTPRMETDALGRFVFHQLPASDGYFLDARGPGFAHTRYGWTQPGQSLTTASISRLRISDDQWIRDIRIPLWRLGGLEGRVLDEVGEPVVGVAVRVFSRRRVAGTVQWVAGPIATTDDRGVYRLTDLDPAQYVVGVPSVQTTVLDTTPEVRMARALGELATGGIGGGGGPAVGGPTIDVAGRHRIALTNFATPPAPGGGARAYPPVFYPAARTPAEAQPIAIGYGDRPGAVDFQLQPVSTARVSGRLVPPAGGGTIPPLLLRLLPLGAEQLGFGGEAATTMVEPDGSFTFLNVPAGDYTLLAQASVMDFTTGSASIRFADMPGFAGGGISVGSNPGAPGLGYLNRMGQASAMWGRVPVSVSRTDIADLVVELRPTTTIRGRIEIHEDSGYLEGTRFRITAEPADGDPSLGEPSAATERGDTSHAFELGGLLGGRYVLNATGEVVSVTHRGRDVTDTGFDATSGLDFDEVVVTVTDQAAEISGMVQGRPDETAAAIIAFPVDPSRWAGYGLSASNFRSTRSASDGVYRLDSLRAGEYFVVAVEAAQIDAWTDPAFLRAAVAGARRVTVDWGETAGLDLTFTTVVVR